MTEFKQDQADSMPSLGSVTESSTVENTGSNVDPTIEKNMPQSVDQANEASIDPEIEFEEQSNIPAQPVLTAEEIKQAKLCHICKVVDWRYTCPRCLTHTCSLTCVKQHKSETGCSGIRDKTSYVPLREYNESNMMSDYTYLEDISRQSDNLTRSRLNSSNELQKKAAENKTKMFVKGANQLGIRFSSLPAGMSRHKLNQSNYSKNLKQIFWSIEVNFCRHDKKERYLEHSFPSGKAFHAFFENMLFSETPFGKGSYGIIRHQVKDFVEAGIDQFMVALKKEKAPRGHFVNVTDVLNLEFKDVLKGETIIEYPIFYIWLKSDAMPKEITTLEDKKQLISVIAETEEIKEPASKELNKEDTKIDDLEPTEILEDIVLDDVVLKDVVTKDMVTKDMATKDAMLNDDIAMMIQQEENL